MADSAAATAPRERSIVLLLAFIQFANILDFVMVMPLGPDFARALHIPASKLGYVGGIYMLAAATSGLIAARFLDRFNRRSALAVSLVGLAIGTACGALAFDMWSLLGARFLAGAFGGPATAISMAIIADVVPFERRGRAMATLMAGFSFASILGIPAGLWLARVGDWHTPFVGVAALVLVAAVAARAMMPSLTGHIGVQKIAVPLRELMKRPSMRLALTLAAVQSFAMFLLIPNLSAYFQGNRGYSRDHIETLYLIGGVLNFGFIAVSGRMVDRMGPVLVSIVGMLMMVASCLGGMVGAHPLLPVLLTFVLFMCSGGPRMVPMSTLSSQVPAPHERGQFMSIQSAVQNIASAIAAVLSAVILGTSASPSEGGPATSSSTYVAPLTNMGWVLALATLLSALAPVMIYTLNNMVRRQRVSAPSNAAPDAITAAH